MGGRLAGRAPDFGSGSEGSTPSRPARGRTHGRSVKDEIKIFAGSSNRALAEEIGRYIGVPLGHKDIFVSRDLPSTAVLKAGALAGLAARVGPVEPGALEVHRHRVEHALDRAFAADLAGLGLGIADPLKELEQVPVRAAVLVDRHGFRA